MHHLTWALALLCCSGSAIAAPSAHQLDIADRVPKFEAFYSEAMATPLDADARFALWQKDYGIAAVPPGPDGDRMARQMLDAAWNKYPALLPKLDEKSAAARSIAKTAFDRINTLFATEDVPIHSRVVLFVGQFDENAYTIPPMEGRPATVMMEVENSRLMTTLAHEITHSVHTQLANVKNSFGAPVGETIFLEGLAMRTAQRVFPGLPETAYSGDASWLAHCYAKKRAIFAGLLPDLDKPGREIAMKYTFGQGNTGTQREAYCAAWIVMGQMLKRGQTLPELARVPEDKMVETIRAAMSGER